MIRSMSEINVKENLRNTLQRVQEACKRRPPELQYIEPTLVAVSKTKPVETIVDVYEEGQRHFGENYVQELEEKANHPTILEKCKDIKWHFIGHLQSNKINKVLALPNIYMVESVDSQKLAAALNKNWPKFGAPETKLNVMVQINTSGEDEKSGTNPSEASNLVKFVLNECPNLNLNGLMTIGKYGHNPADGPNPDFICLRKCRDDVCQDLALDWKKINLSMGMSNDFEQAIEMGSTNVRVGSTIFGERAKKN